MNNRKFFVSNGSHYSALMLGAGLGTRLGAITANTPKPILNIAGIGTPLEFWLERLKRLGISDVSMNSFYLAERVVEFAEERNLHVNLLLEDQLRGGLNTVRDYAVNFLPTQLLVIYVDTLISNPINESNLLWEPASPLGKILLFEVKEHGSYGYVTFDPVPKFIQKPEKRPESTMHAFAGVFSLNTDGLRSLKSMKLEKFNDGIVEEFLLPRAAQFEYWGISGAVFDIGTPEALKEIGKLYEVFS